jgi:hypothetical protein
MPPQEQADLWMALRDRMKVNWAELTVQEKKAGTSYSPFSISNPFTLNLWFLPVLQSRRGGARSGDCVRRLGRQQRGDMRLKREHLADAW